MAPMPLPADGFPSLRTKFVLFFSLILIIACSTLSWYYVEERREAMADNLQQLGTILLTSVVHNEHFQYAGLVAEDRATLQQFIEGLMAVQDVVYVVITRSDGTVLAQHTKGSRQSSASLVRSVDHPLYPDTQIAKQLFQSPNTTPLMTRFSLSTKIGNRFAWEEIVYDFAMPVLRTAKGSTSLPPFSIQLDEGSTNSSPTQPALVSGVVQIGLTDAHLKHELADDDQKYSPPHRLHHRRRRARRLPAHPPYHEAAEEPCRVWLDKWLRATRLCPSHPPPATKSAN